MKQPKKLTRQQKEILTKRFKGIDPEEYGLSQDFKDSFVIVNRKTKELQTIEY